MSLNTKKYWLDGIFDDEEYVVPKEDLKPQVEVKSLSLTSPVVEKFIHSTTFQGSINGYIFKSGEEGIGYYKDTLSISPVVEKKVVAQWWSREEILCRNFIYCDNASCGKRHYYRRRYETRIWERDFAKKYAYSPEFVENETRETLNRVIIRLAGDGVRAIVR